MKNPFRYFIFAFVLLVASSGCKKDSSKEVINYYSGSGGIGDVMSYTVNQTTGGYTVHNETRGLYANGSFTVYNNELNGLYKVYTNGSFYYAVELPGQVFAGNFPTSALDNNLCCGISTLSNVVNQYVQGDYVYIYISNSAVNGSTMNKEWGILSLAADGKWMKKSYCNDTGTVQQLMPEQYTGPLPIVNASDSGTWIVNPIYPERMIMATNNSHDSLTGFAYASDTGGIFIMDMGYKRGYIVGCKILPANPNKIRGNYGYADIRYDGSLGGGKYTVNDTAYYVTWWRADSYAKIRSGVFGSLSQCSVLKNVWYRKNAVVYGDTVDFYTAVSGPYLLEFQFRNNQFRSYGTGARLP
jgi:hypothetical protein